MPQTVVAVPEIAKRGYAHPLCRDEHLGVGIASLRNLWYSNHSLRHVASLLTLGSEPRGHAPGKTKTAAIPQASGPQPRNTRKPIRATLRLRSCRTEGHFTATDRAGSVEHLGHS